MRYLSDRTQTDAVVFRAYPEIGAYLLNVAARAHFQLGLRSETARGKRKPETGYVLHCLCAWLRRQPPEVVDQILREGAAETARLAETAPDFGLPSEGVQPGGHGLAGSVLPPRGAGKKGGGKAKGAEAAVATGHRADHTPARIG